MLKKAGIVAAAVTAGLLAASPLAFASDKVADSQICSADQTYGGLINLLNLANGNVVSCNDINVQVGAVNTNEQ